MVLHKNNSALPKHIYRKGLGFSAVTSAGLLQRFNLLVAWFGFFFSAYNKVGISRLNKLKSP